MWFILFALHFTPRYSLVLDICSFLQFVNDVGSYVLYLQSPFNDFFIFHPVTVSLPRLLFLQFLPANYSVTHFLFINVFVYHSFCPLDDNKHFLMCRTYLTGSRLPGQFTVTYLDCFYLFHTVDDYVVKRNVE